ncbi:MAG: tRNA (adenosine(37)-N6)-threonylcarbamoyltransferase complex transferase subunit TsaD, partial [Pseudomonadota bacterium]
QDLAAQHGLSFVAPPLALCTDNAAMIAWAGIELDAIGHPGMEPLIPRPRWPLDNTAPALLGSGKKGAKA